LHYRHEAKSLTGINYRAGSRRFNAPGRVSAAKGLAFSLEIPIVGINSLEMAAYQYAETGLPSALFSTPAAVKLQPRPIRKNTANGSSCRRQIS